MKKLLLIGVPVVSIMGTLFHFLYDYIPVFIFPQNESIFEHLKLIFYPFWIYFLITFIFYKDDKRELFKSFFLATLISMGFIVVAYYTYSGIIGKSVDFVNIIIYYLAVILGFYFIYKKKILLDYHNSIIFFVIINILFVVLTFYPLSIAFFL